MISFIHSGGPQMASYRYRAAIPARQLGVSLNDITADVLVFSKPTTADFHTARMAKDSGRTVVVDFCDDHFNRFPHYGHMARLADAVVACTPAMAGAILEYTGVEATPIGDPYEYPLADPHCRGNKLLWFGHAVNFGSLQRILPHLDGYPLRVVSNVEGSIPWSTETMFVEFLEADIVVLPATAFYKSANRAIESIRRGCFVVAEQHPAVNEIPGIWIGNIKEGIEWAHKKPQSANSRTKLAQEWVERYSPRTLGSAWRNLLERVRPGCTLVAERSTGTDG